jgi:hypothetical protein
LVTDVFVAETLDEELAGQDDSEDRSFFHMQRP